MIDEAETIFAISSGGGMAGICVIRVSGPCAMSVLGQLAGRLPRARQASLRKLRDPNSGDVIDEGIVLTFPKPGSFTGEDVCEFHVHGSLAVGRALLAVLGAIPGLRQAEPGEFTRRAVRNGRLDLIEAEGLADLIHARTERQRKQAIHHSLGAASDVAGDWRNRLIGILGRVEAAIDFVDEPGIAEEAMKNVSAPLVILVDDMKRALKQIRSGAAIRDGIRIVLAGPPNVGKSSIFNFLARRDAAIVSPQPGTTRDVIEVTLELDGIAVIISDTAGLRETAVDDIEFEGIARTRRELGSADIVVWVSAFDHRVGPPAFDSDTIWIENKSDLATGSDPQGRGCHPVSAKTGAGMEEFIDILTARANFLVGIEEPAALIRLRHEEAVWRCVRDLEKAIDSSPKQIEMMAERLRSAAQSLAQLIGTIGVEDVLDSIFREFCIGK